MEKLRRYQTEVVEKIKELVRYGENRILLQAPTGSGKTNIAAELIRYWHEEYGGVLFMAHRRELIFQAKKRLNSFDLEVGVIMAGIKKLPVPIQVASVDTLWRRCYRSSVMEKPPASLVVIDEAHRSGAMTYQKIIESYKDSVILGLTATPIRTDGNGLGDIYNIMLQTPNIKSLTNDKYLVPIRYFAPTKPDLSNIQTVAGDYHKGQLESRMDQVKLIGDIVENWTRIAKDRITVVFASGIRHSIHIRDRFRAVGVYCEHIDGYTPKDQRDEILDRLDCGELQVVTNCAVLQEGWDQKKVSCAILARPTKSIGLFFQMAGRILRPYGGKENAIIIDHSGAVFMHGLIADFDGWKLEKGKEFQKEHIKKISEKGKIITCSKCGALHTFSLICPECGNKFEMKGKNVTFIDGYLVELGDEKIEETLTKQQWFSGLYWYAKEHRKFEKACAWTKVRFKTKFGVWPKGLEWIVEYPEKEVWAFIHKGNETYRKMMRENDKLRGGVINGNHKQQTEITLPKRSQELF